MKGKELNQSLNRRGSILWMVLVAFFMLTGCASFGSISLNKAVMKYDDTVLRSEQELLLLNIIRMHYDQPPHFTVASSIAATFTLSYTGSLTGSTGRSLTGLPSTSTSTSTAGLTLGTTFSENPTITITPMQGKDFAQRLLQPIDTKFVNTVLLQQGGPKLDKMLRLTSADFFMRGPGRAKKIFERIALKDFKETKYNYPFPNLNDLQDKELNDWAHKGGFTEDEARCLLEDFCYIENRPPIVPSEATIKREDIQHYELFRKLVLHVKALGLNGRLFVFSLDFDVPNEGIKGTFRNDLEKEKSIKDIIDAFEKQYHWHEVPESATQRQGFVVKKRYPVHALTDFDFAQMKDKEEFLTTVQKDLELNEEIAFGESIIIVLFRGDEDNRWPIYGYFTVRNFRQVLQFLAESLIKDHPGYASEYKVTPSQLTNDLLCKTKKLQPGCLDNPELTLTITSGTTPPRDRLIDTEYNQQTFWIPSPRDQTGAHRKPKEWDNPYPLRWDGEIFSMLYEIFEFNRTEPAVTVPSISISK
jgi:hypothetical protein